MTAELNNAIDTLADSVMRFKHAVVGNPGGSVIKYYSRSGAGQRRHSIARGLLRRVRHTQRAGARARRQRRRRDLRPDRHSRLDAVS